MFKRFWRWLTGKPNFETEAQDTGRRRPSFWQQAQSPVASDNLPGKPSAGALLDSHLDDMLSKMPKVYRHAMPAGVDGHAMDSDDGAGSLDDTMGITSGDGPGTGIGLRDESPNLSGAIAGFFMRQSFIGYQLAGLLAQHWLIDKCCSMPARDSVRHGFSIVTPEGDELDSPEIIGAMRRIDKRMKLNKNLIEFVRKGKTFGIRVAIFKVRSADPDYYLHPFNEDAVLPGTYEGISQVDPYWTAPELDAEAASRPGSMHFYEPTWWIIDGKRYHRSHLMIYREGDPADILKPSYLYGGIPVPQQVVERVYAAERTANEAPELAMCKRLLTLKTDMAEMLAGGPEAFERLDAWVELMNNYGVKVIGTDDQIDQYDTSLADFDALTMTQYQLVAAAAKVPATKLLGTSPKGFGAAGEYETESYHEELESIQNEHLTEFVERHHRLVMLSQIAPRMRMKDPAWMPPETCISWEPLDTPTAKEWAEINEIKSRTGQNLINSGAIDGVDERDRIIADKNSDYTGLPGAYRPGEEGLPESKDKVPAPVPTTQLQAAMPEGAEGMADVA